MIRDLHAALVWTVGACQFLMAVYWLFLVKIGLPNIVHRPHSFGVWLLFALIFSACVAGYGGYLLVLRRAFTPISSIMCIYTLGLSLFGLAVIGREMHG